MGGGNGNKKARSQAKHAKEAAGSVAKSSLNDASKVAIKCKVCFQTFAVTTKKAELEQHWENKHPKKDLGECFD